MAQRVNNMLLWERWAGGGGGGDGGTEARCSVVRDGSEAAI